MSNLHPPASSIGRSTKFACYFSKISSLLGQCAFRLQVLAYELRIDSRRWTATYWRWRGGVAAEKDKERHPNADENGGTAFEGQLITLFLAQNIISPSRKVTASPEEEFAYLMKWCKSRLVTRILERGGGVSIWMIFDKGGGVELVPMRSANPRAQFRQFRLFRPSIIR